MKLSPTQGQPNPQTFERYGLDWSRVASDPWIEISMIRKGGRWKNKSGTKKFGRGMIFHFMQLIKLLWPDIVLHKWNRRIIKAFLRKRTIVVVGPASSGKTHTAAVCALADWYCFPSSTTVICCSTTRERLEDRVWGEIKKLHKEAKARWPWLDGRLIESRQRIILDTKQEDVVGSDFRNGLVGVPCLPEGSLVDTPSGTRPIETLRVGDIVINAVGSGVVRQIYCNPAKRLVRVHLADGRAIDCTGDHPIFCSRGWVNAIDLTISDMVFSGDETLQIVRESTPSRLSKSKILQRSLPRFFAFKEMRPMRKCISAMESEGFMDREFLGSILLSEMCEPMGCGQSTQIFNPENMCPLRQTLQRHPPAQAFLFHSLPAKNENVSVRGMWPKFSINSRISSEAKNSFLRQGLPPEGFRPRGRIASIVRNETGVCNFEKFSRNADALSDSDGPNKPERGAGALLRSRPVSTANQADSGSGRKAAYPTFAKGQNQGQVATGTRVDRVEILQSAGDPRFSKSEGGYRVYNLEVAGHPSYSVNGVIVHNCKKGEHFVGLGDFAGVKNKRVRLIGDELSLLPRVFVDCFSNLDKNPDFKAMGLGNPKETTDALGVLAEPHPDIGGWESGIDQTPYTKEWPIRRPDGVCIQLPGSDSPNLDGKLGIPLITQEQIDRDVAFYGKDSLWYTMMDQGTMPRGQGSRRVITRSFCLRHHAMDQPLWASTERTRIGFLDAAFRAVGGDRCIFGELQFGYEVQPVQEVSASAIINQTSASNTNKQVMALIDMVLVPLLTTSNIAREPEDQIVAFVKAQCERRNIPPQNFFFDSSMRGSLVTAFMRNWSTSVNAIDFGGKPTERPVSGGIDVACCDYYSKFVTELWFSVRLIIEAEQFRGMTEEALMEGSAREWKMVAGNKIEVERKDEMKLKTGRSPDLFDGLCFVENTMVLTPTGEVPIQNIRPGDVVTTPFGQTAVIKIHSPMSPSTTIASMSNGRSLEGTGEHKVFTDRGWVRLDALRIDNELEAADNLWKWKLLDWLFTRDRSTGFKAMVDTIRAARLRVNRRDFYIESFGKRLTELFLGIIQSITLMVISGIIRFLIFGLWKPLSIAANTCASALISSAVSLMRSPRLAASSPQNGTAAPREENGIHSTVKKHGPQEWPFSLDASNVAGHSRRSSRGPSSAAFPAVKNLHVPAIKTFLRFARSVAKSFWRIVTTGRNTVRIIVPPLRSPESKRVYNLTLEDHNVFFANGVLVANCCGVEGARRLGFKIAKTAAPARPVPGGASWKRELEDQAKQFWSGKNLSYR